MLQMNKSKNQEVNDLRSNKQKTTPTLKILFTQNSAPNVTFGLKTEDLFENGLIFDKISQLFEEVYFNENMDDTLSVYCYFLESIGKANQYN